MSEILRESQLQTKVVQWAKDHGILCKRLGDDGWPDYLFFYMGAVALIEFKMPGGKIRLRQIYYVQQLNKHNIPSAILDDYDDCIAFLDSALISGARGAAMRQASLCGFVDEAWVGQDYDHVHGLQDPKGSGIR